MTSYRGAEIKKALALALPHLLSNWAESGGFFFRENEPMTYGHELMSSQGNEAGAFPTWFRLQSMAFMSKVLKSPELAFDWKFIDCPGMTFWRPVPETGGNK
jgi:hypothetical protein